MDYDELAALESAEVQTEDGEVVGEIVAVHVDEGSDQARLIEIADEERTQHYVVPIGEASVSAEGIVLPYTAYEVEHGPSVGQDDVLSVGEIGSIVSYYGAGRVDFAGHSLTHQSADTSSGTDAETQPFIKKNLPPVVSWTEPEATDR